MRMRYMTLEDATLAGASMTDLDRDLELDADAEDAELDPWDLAD
ncbi:hypothetical protein HOS58_gp38 [Streptomyces phage Attoomi]|uniref:Uncharacterized protein n=1 Tax=Streptomyces phage Attoomi TaxID=2059881 RepID=A0A2H5BLG2_9CAUD|nr:hypothetical protein HOS58_gp38 [Streptomyces phage Attoomi]AUG87170.1 hypothetical protein SEA_ATTOOMI_38 [Streptomyces phage Attoomi]